MRHTLSSLQWGIFIFASIIVAPLSVGHAFGMSAAEITGLLQRTFFIMGIASLLQGFFGHRLPLLNGPAGLWWSVFLMFAGFVTGSGDGAQIILRSLELGLLISGALFIGISLFRWMDHVKKLFTPAVTGSYLLLLVCQLSGPFMKGMLGVGYENASAVIPKVAIAALATLIFSVLLARSRNHWLSSYSVLISIAFGWILFAVLGIAKPITSAGAAWFSLPHVLVWGAPAFNLGVVITSIFTAFLLMANMVASINVVADVSEHTSNANVYNRSGIVMGINQALTGLFSAVGGVPMSSAAGFIATTKIKERLAFLIGSALVTIISLFPQLMAFFASIPMPVGYATIFLSISSLLGLALRQFRAILQEERQVFLVGFSLMAGFGAMFVPEQAWAGMPNALTSVMNNGLVVGVLVCIVMEQIAKLRAGSKETRNDVSA